MWFLRIAEELSNVVPANRRGAIYYGFCDSQKLYQVLLRAGAI